MSGELASKDSAFAQGRILDLSMRYVPLRQDGGRGTYPRRCRESAVVRRQSFGGDPTSGNDMRSPNDPDSGIMS